jgi:phosphotransferase system, enzyme I, PtsP
VPIIRRERAVGVLAVQHSEQRKYQDVEIEALQTVAMVLSELIANAGLIDTAAGASGREKSTAAIRLPGQKLVEGMGPGYAVFHQPRIVIEHTVAEDTDAERHRVYAAFDKMREQIDRMTRRPSSASAASMRRSCRPTRCSPMTKAGHGGSTRRSTAA